jgi:hypothetical protein
MSFGGRQKGNPFLSGLISSFQKVRKRDIQPRGRIFERCFESAMDYSTTLGIKENI